MVEKNATCMGGGDGGMRNGECGMGNGEGVGVEANLGNG